MIFSQKQKKYVPHIDTGEVLKQSDHAKLQRDFEKWEINMQNPPKSRMGQSTKIPNFEKE